MRAVVLIILMLVQLGLCDYSCVCNYAEDTPIYSDHDTSTSVINHLYEFDCTPTYKPTANRVPKWQAVVKDRQIGYVRLDSFIMQQQCRGNPDPVDTVAMTTGASTPTTTVMTSSSATPKGTVAGASPAVSTMSPQRVTVSTSSSSPGISQTSSMLSSSTFKTTQKTIKTSTIAAQTTTRQTITLSPSLSPSTTTTTTTTTPRPVTYKPVIATQIHPISSIHFCPPDVMAAVHKNGGFAKVHGNSCYELVPIRATWQNAEQDCRDKGGHLVHMSSGADEYFVMELLRSQNYKLAVWTGLNDINNEEHFSWSSGDTFVYSKWTPGRKSNFFHHYEDCVILVPYLHAGFLHTYGQWDDVNCIQRHPWICRYDTHNSQVTTLAPVINLLMNLFGK